MMWNQNLKSNKVFIDIGYTNIKILMDDSISIYPVKQTIKLIKQLIESKQCYISCNHHIYLKKLKKIKNTNLFLVTYNDLINDILIADHFKINEIGIDILLMVYYLKQNKITDAIVVCSGSCLVCFVLKNSVLIDINIMTGFTLESNAITKLINHQKIIFSTDESYFNLQKCLNKTYIEKIQSTILYKSKQYNIYVNIYITGNYLKNFVINNTDDYPFSQFKYVDNMTLIGNYLKNK